MTTEQRIAELKETIRQNDQKIERLKRPPTMDERDAIAKAYHRADSTYGLVGQQPPRHMPGESPIAYRARLARNLRRFSKTMRSYGFDGDTLLADARAFDAVESELYRQVEENAKDGVADLPGRLHEVQTVENGKQVSRFYGDQRVAWEPFMPMVRTFIKKITVPH